MFSQKKKKAKLSFSKNNYLGKTIKIKIKKGIKLRVQFLKLGTLDSPIEFKHMVALTNETQTILFFPRIFEFN